MPSVRRKIKSVDMFCKRHTIKDVLDGEPDEGAIARYGSKMRWEQGRAREFCNGGDGCPGPSVANISFGPDGGGSMIITACNAACAGCIRDGMPTSAWVTHPEMWAEEILNQERKVAGDNLLE
jgi:hypothetical protein